MYNTALKGESVHRKYRLSVITVAAIFLLNVIATLMTSCVGEKGGSNYTLVFADVGQGDAAFVVSDDGSAVLIDCGTAEYSVKLIAEMKKYRVKRIYTIFLSHAHDDHFGGLFDVLSEFDVGKVVMPECSFDGSAGSKFDLWVKNGLKVVYTVCGDVYEPIGCRVNVLSPERVEDGGGNEDSAVMMMSIGKLRVLFTGDAGFVTEEFLTEKYGKGLAADILKVGHHGSAGSSGENFLSAVAPTVAVISVGRSNGFGLPSGNALERIGNTGAAIYRTDLDGTVVFHVDKSGYRPKK